MAGNLVSIKSAAHVGWLMSQVPVAGIDPGSASGVPLAYDYNLANKF